MNKDKISELNDKESLQVLIAGILNARIERRDDTSFLAFADRMEPVLRKCVENLEELQKVTTKLSNTSEELLIEKLSNRRLKAIIDSGYKVLGGNPDCYPEPIRAFVQAIHKEVKGESIPH